MATETHPEGLTRPAIERRRSRAWVAARAAACCVLAGSLVDVTGAQGAPFQPAPFDVFASPARVAYRRESTEKLVASLNTTLQRTRGAGTWGVLVVSLTTGDTLFGHNADRGLLPASTMKLFTSALALDRFGAMGRFETQLVRTGPVGPDGVLHGDLVLRGAGDPTLGGQPTEYGLSAPMVRLARAVADAGITRVSGSLVGDASGFDDGKVPDGWLRRYLMRSYAARVSALSFNENQIAVLVRPDGKRGAVAFRPAVSGIDVVNEVKIVAGSRSARVRVAQDSALGRIRVTGWIGSRSGERDYRLVVENPELFAVGAFRSALLAEGVKIDGPIRIGTSNDSTTSVATLESPTMTQMVEQMNGESNNHFAELLFRNVARAAGAAGSAVGANVLLSRFLLEKVRTRADAVYAADGSGLSTLDRVTPRAMVQLLAYATLVPWGSVLEQSLPVAGRTETLARRMRRTAATGNLRAKTGTTNDVASLGGYVKASNGEELVFSIIYNGSDRSRAREAIDRIGVTLATFTR